MWEIFTNNSYAPLRKDIRVGNCPEYVSSLQILEEIELAIKPKSTGLDYEHLPNKSWLVNVLYTLKPSHKFFCYSKSQNDQETKIEK